jgi:ribonuclease E
MLIDATHPEETRVVVLNGNRLEEFDFETSTKKQIKGNIYLAKITRVEPSLQAAFVEYGGNRHGFLAFSEIHPDYYRIPVSDREAMLAEERAAQFEEEQADSVDLDHEGNSHYREDHAATGHDGDEDVGHDRGGDDGDGHEGDSHDHPTQDGDDHGHYDDRGEPYDAAALPAEHATEFVVPSEAAPDASPSELASSGGTDPAESPLDIAAQKADDGLVVATSYAPRAVEPGDAAPESDQPPVFGDADEAAPAAPEPVEFDALPVEGDGAVTSVVEVPDEPVHVETVGGEDEFEEVQARPRVRHYRNYKIQEVIKRRQILLIQVTKEERGNKGAALTTYLSLAGRYCVLMPNAGRGGGVSRKITSAADRRRLKELMEELDVPEGMGIIVRTAGSERSKAEIKRDYEYLLRLWDDIRELTLRSSAPALIYEEGNLIKRAIRDLYSRDMEEILVEGEDGFRTAKEFMRMLMPSHASRVKAYRDPTIPLLHRFQVDSQIDQIHNPVVQLRSGGYIVINPTEALVSIDVNSGRATKERNIEETATKTNLEAAEEIARQLRLRDLAGLVVIDFIDMEEMRNQKAVEARLKDAMKTDRARIQLGRISAFGLLELSRQRLRSSLIEASTQTCPHCNGTGTIRSTESTALVVLRALEEEGIRRRSAELTIYVPTQIALYVLNQKRDALSQIEQRYGFRVTVAQDDELVPPAFRLDRVRALTPQELGALPLQILAPLPVEEEEEEGDDIEEEAGPVETAETRIEGEARRKRRRRKRQRGGGEEALAAPGQENTEMSEQDAADSDEEVESEDESATEDSETPSAELTPEGIAERKRRRRGKRGGRRRRREDEAPLGAVPAEALPEAVAVYVEEYPSALDYARDGREHLFEQIETSPSAGEEVPVSESAPAELPGAETALEPTATIEMPPIEPAAAETAGAEIALPKPKRKRVPRKTPALAEAAADDARLTAPEPAADAVEAVPPKRRRTRKVAVPVAEAAAEAPASEVAVDAPVAYLAEPAMAIEQPGATIETVPASIDPAVAEPAPAQSAAAAALETPLTSADAESTAPEVQGPQTAEPEAQTAQPDRPRKTGWWKRLVN